MVEVPVGIDQPAGRLVKRRGDGALDPSPFECRSQAFPVRSADSSIANTNATLFDARRSPFRALRSAAPSATATRGGRAQPRAVGPRSSDEAGRAATSSGPLAGGGELESQPAGLREIETTIGC